MSRCFPYPPPGYALSGANKEALIESIKLQKEREKAKAKEQRKEKKNKKEARKKEKEERKKEKKDKRREKKDEANQNPGKSDIVQGLIDKKLSVDVKGDLHNKVEQEVLEQSTLTEEHGLAIPLRVPSTSSDSTENSNKRKRQDSPTVVTRGHGKIIRIRLSSKKQNEPPTSTNEQQPCSTSGRTESCSQDKDKIALRHHREYSCSASEQTNNIARGSIPKANQGQICLTPQPVGAIASGKSVIRPATTNALLTKMQKMELKYQSLFENWVPPQLQDAPLDPDDQDWLFGPKKGVCAENRRHIPINDPVPSFRNSTSWPRAQYLQEVDVYALPFTVPF